MEVVGFKKETTKNRSAEISLSVQLLIHEHCMLAHKTQELSCGTDFRVHKKIFIHN